ncbi:MAG: hypothetical protein NZ908_02775, partial [Candidatus Micrarchaeota archaeon]|nr:hypothetical protein [Candidatus Micrarchaeota archaeon]
DDYLARKDVVFLLSLYGIDLNRKRDCFCLHSLNILFPTSRIYLGKVDPNPMLLIDPFSPDLFNLMMRDRILYPHSNKKARIVINHAEYSPEELFNDPDVKTVMNRMTEIYGLNNRIPEYFDGLSQVIPKYWEERERVLREYSK